MKALGDILPAMKSPEDSQKEQRHGLMTTGGALTIAPHNRESPLTQEQLTEIASRVLTRPLKVTSTERTKYGRKLIEGQWFDNEPIGTEIVASIEMDLRGDCPAKFLNAALAMSPRSASTNHITRLAAHKKFFGSSDKDRPVLLVDYAIALAEFPEFVVFSVCRHFWENDKRPFVPFIAELREACELMTAKLEGAKNPQIENQQEQKMRAQTEEQSAIGKEFRRTMCNFLVEKGEPDYYEQTRMMSNYQLERLAIVKHGWKNPNDSDERDKQHSPT